jgi:bisanhydrobacterioruberin hydratase
MRSLVKYHRYLVGWLILVHLSGFIGLILSPDLFIGFTPFNLLLSSALIVASQIGADLRFYMALFFTALAGWFIESVGVNTGMLFGDYSYGPTLGWGFIGVPWLIGVNWAILVLVALQVSVHGLKIKSRWKVALVATGLLVALDVLMEFSAPGLRFWSFYSGNNPVPYPGLQNFIAWAITGFGLSYAAYPSLMSKGNHLAAPYLAIQMAFFLLLAFFL